MKIKMTEMILEKSDKSFLKKIVPIAAFVAGLCCFTPVVLVLFGIGTVAYAASLSDLLYGSYKWFFRGVALLFLFGALFWYFYKKKNICTFDEAVKQRRRIINLTLITLILGIIVYIVWLYGVVELIGIFLKIW